MKIKVSHLIAFIGIAVLAAFFRFYNLTWDSGFYLHPDERFLTMVGSAMKIPASFSEYLSPALSLMNPTNINYTFYVYGIFPLVINKFLAIQLNGDSYGSYGIIGRSLSATFDMFTLFLVYKIGQLFEREYKLKVPFALVAAFFYAIAVLPIQLAHYFTVDPYLNFFCTLTLYFSLVFAITQKKWAVPLAGLAFGLAIACKVSAIYMLPVFGMCLFIGAVRVFHAHQKTKAHPHLDIKHAKQAAEYYLAPRVLFNTLVATAAFAFVCYIAIRLAAPYYWETSNFADITINSKFQDNIEQLKGFETTEGYFPPAIQWMNKPVTFSLMNMAIFGMGIPYFILMLIGISYLLQKYRNLIVYSLIFWCFAYFVYHSVGFVKVMRYTIFMYPVLSLFAAAGFLYVTSRRPRPVAVIIGVLTLIWPLMFMNIYMHQHSRVEASYWIDENLPNNSIVLNESWDDGLPMLVPGYKKTMLGENVEVFGPDTPEKFAKLNEQMQRADYYFMTSNRAWGSIPTVPDKYPQMVPWYQNMFAGKLGYKKIKEFTVYPSLEWLGIPLTLPDQWSDESFTVYDHPKVMIFENQKKKAK